MCGNIFTTYETAALESGIVVQYSSSDIRAFERDQLFVSMYDACKHRKDAVATATALTRTVIAELLRHSTGSILLRSAVVTACSTVLGRFDLTAQTVYDAYHSA